MSKFKIAAIVYLTVVPIYVIIMHFGFKFTFPYSIITGGVSFFLAAAIFVTMMRR